MTGRGKNRYDIDRLVSLDDDLGVLLRTLDELDSERTSGDVSQSQYDRLHARYTAQAADLIRKRSSAARRRTVAPPKSRRARAAVAAGLAAFLGVAGLAIASATGDRAPGQTITGNAVADSSPERRAVEANPDDPAAHNALAASLMQQGEFAAALAEFDKAAQLDPRDPVALTYSGWIAYLAGSPEKALPRLAQAVAADPTYPDARAFHGIVLLRAGDDPAAARAELERYLQLVPDGAMSDQVKAVLAQAQEPAG